MTAKVSIYTSVYEAPLDSVWVSDNELRVLAGIGASLISMEAASARHFGQRLVAAADEAEARAIGRLSKDEE
jgi:hypothetical protein